MDGGNIIESELLPKSNIIYDQEADSLTDLVFDTVRFWE